MKDYSEITQVKTTESVQETNELLSGEWVLMDVCRRVNGGPLFVLGLPYTFDLEAFCNIGTSIAEARA